MGIFKVFSFLINTGFLFIIFSKFRLKAIVVNTLSI